MAHTFRPRPYYRKLGLVCLCVFTAMAVYSAVGMAFEARQHRLLAVLIFPMLWSPFIGMSLWLLLACQRERLTVRDDEVRQQGVWSTETVHLSRLSELR